MRWKKIILIGAMVVCTVFGLIVAFFQNDIDIKSAKAAATDDVSNFYDMATEPSLSVLGTENFGIQFNLKRRYVSSNPNSANFSPLNLLTEYDYSVFEFAIGSESQVFCRYRIVCDYDYIASYKLNGSYKGYDIDFNTFDVDKIYSPTYSQLCKDRYTDCTLVGVVPNSNKVFFPFLNNECKITISGDSIEHTVGYYLQVDYGVAYLTSREKDYQGDWFAEFFQTDDFVWKNEFSEYEGFLKKPLENSSDVPFGISLKTLCKDILANPTLAVQTLGTEDSVNYQYAEKLASSSIVKTITVRWLEDLPLTPFAKLRETNIDVEVDDMGVMIADVEKALKEQHDIVFDRVACRSIIEKFDKIGDGDIYEAVYEAKIVVTVKTKDGNSDYFTIDCNKSLEAFYKSSDTNNLRAYEILGVDFSGPMINEIVTNMYPVLSSTYDIEYANQLYGLWGFVVIPETDSFSFNMLMASDGETDKQNVLKSYDMKGTVTKEQYELLMTSYGYSDISIYGNKIAQYFDTNTKNCTCVLFFCDGESDTAGAVQPGQSFDSADDDPVWLDKVQKTWDNVTDWVKDLFETDKDPEEMSLRALKIIGSVSLLIFGLLFLIKAVKGGGKNGR